MLVYRQLSLLDECAQRFFFKNQIVLRWKHVKKFWLTNKKTTRDATTSCLWFLIKFCDDSRFVTTEFTESSRWAHTRDGQCLSALFMKCKQLVQINIAEPITVREKETFIFHILLNFSNPCTSHRFGPRIGQCYLPIQFIMFCVIDDLRIRTQCDSAVSGASFIIKEKIFDYMTLVSQAKNKIIVPEMRVVLHEMPQNG